MATLGNADVGQRIRNFVRKLYWNQEAVIRCEGVESEEIPIRKGVCQGCILSPAFFNIFRNHFRTGHQEE